MKEKGIEAIIAYGKDLPENASDVMFNEITGMLMEKLKNSLTSLKEKKNIIELFDNIISNEIEIKEDDGLLEIGSQLEIKGKQMMKKVGISKEELREWKELKDAAALLELRIINKRKEKRGEERKSIMKIVEEKEYEKKEKEKNLKEKEAALLREKEYLEKAEIVRKEKEELKKALEYEKSDFILDHENNPLLVSVNQSISSLSSLSLLTSNARNINREGNLIIHYGENGYETCAFDIEMKKVCF